MFPVFGFGLACKGYAGGLVRGKRVLKRCKSISCVVGKVWETEGKLLLALEGWIKWTLSGVCCFVVEEQEQTNENERPKELCMRTPICQIFLERTRARKERDEWQSIDERRNAGRNGWMGRSRWSMANGRMEGCIMGKSVLYHFVCLRTA